MSIGIFIKTCKKDHEWLKWCLLSIQQNIYDFDGVCIVTDSDHTNIDEYEDIIKKINGYVVHIDVPTVEHSCQDGIGYLWMQNLKLNWHTFCDYDAVLQIDSDCIVSSILTPKYFMSSNNKYKWFVRSWALSKFGLVHRKPLNKLLDTDSKYEHMPYNGWVLNRNDTISFHEWIYSKHKCSWWEYLLNQTKEDWGKSITDYELRIFGCSGRSRGSSIYNAYGGFLETQTIHDHIFVNSDEIAIEYHPITQYWSWGGQNNDIKASILKILDYSNIQKILIEDQKFIDFDDDFYIEQQPSAYKWIDIIPESLKLTNKQKLFYHFRLLSQILEFSKNITRTRLKNCFNKIRILDKELYINRTSYEDSLLGDIVVDTDFDHIFYMSQYPETATYFMTAPYPLAPRKKLYHHYKHYGSKQGLCKNQIELAKILTNIKEPIPDWFTTHAYLNLCPEAKDYCLPEWHQVPVLYRLYHHYLNCGRHISIKEFYETHEVDKSFDETK